ncbi:MAG: hypothetical protein OXI77_10015 [Chloroflexota bacterium]|nr:hypothetical protein [Chloroflexota bacterium]MDE2909209.1 hypothetical protein [Chloroflexota bacterium]
MQSDKPPLDADEVTEQLTWLAEMLRMDVEKEDLMALSEQLRRIDALEKAALRDVPPILRMDAGWHD